MVEEIQRSTGAMLVVGVEPEGVRVALLETVGGSYRLIGWLGLQPDPALDLAQLVANACQRLSVRLGRRLWSLAEDGPLLASEDEIRHPALRHVALGVTPRPHLRVWLAGLSQSLGLTPLAQVLSSGPVRIVGQTVLNTQLQSGRLTNALQQAQPEVLVLVGGYDDPAAEPQQGLLLLSKVVGQAVARLAPGQRPAILVAGNRLAAPQVEELLRISEGPLRLELLSNFQPAPGVVQGRELATTLQQHYWRVCQRLPGFAALQRWVTPPGQITSLAVSFVQLAQVWCEYQHLPQIHAIYCTPEWRLHVWVQRDERGVRQYFAEPLARPTQLRAWPPAQLLSGSLPRGVGQSYLPLALRWWDRSGLAPIVATVGQISPLAMIQVLEQDILTEEHPYG